MPRLSYADFLKEVDQESPQKTGDNKKAKSKAEGTSTSEKPLPKSPPGTPDQAAVGDISTTRIQPSPVRTESVSKTPVPPKLAKPVKSAPVPPTPGLPTSPGTPTGPAPLSTGTRVNKALNPFTTPKKKVVKVEERQQLVCFALGGEEYAIDIMDVQEIYEKKNVHPLPKQPDFVLGVTYVRENVVPVIDLATRMGLNIPDSRNYPFLMIVKIKNEIVGLAVENVTEVRTFVRNELENAPSLPRSGDSEFFEGIYIVDGHLLIVLKVGRILSSAEITDISSAIEAVRSHIKVSKKESKKS